MLFMPVGPFPGDGLDPGTASRDFVEAARIAAATSQWQWAKEAFTSKDIGLLEYGSHLAFDQVSVDAVLNQAPNTAPVFPDDVGYDVDLWKIPYNRGFSPIDSMQLTWQSSYPELLVSFFSFQFLRRNVATGPAEWVAFWAAVAGRNPRIQIRTRCDNAIMPGTGPYANAMDGKYRGLGFVHRGLASLVISAQLLPAGNHTLEAVAAQAPAWQSGEDTASATGASEEEASTAVPGDGICIGNRKLAYVRLARGAWMEGM